MVPAESAGDRTARTQAAQATARYEAGDLRRGARRVPPRLRALERARPALQHRAELSPAARYAEALYFYRAFLGVQPDAINRADVEARIAEMAHHVLDGSDAAAQADAARRPSLAVAARVDPDEDGGNRQLLRVAALTVGVAGIASVAVGGWLLGTMPRGAAGETSGAAPSRGALGATALVATGVPTIAAGVLLAALGWRKAARLPVAVAAGVGGSASVIWSGTF